jgi:hypothetical protein
MTNATFTYSLKIKPTSGVLPEDETALPNVNEVYVMSQKYDKFSDCEAALAKVLSFASYKETARSNDLHVVYSKLNPVLRPVPNPGEPKWNDHVIIRAYVASANKLKKGTLDYQITAFITTDVPLKNGSAPSKPYQMDLFQP